jgi:hypothetical protein
MLKGATCSEKFKLLEPWWPAIIERVKKELKHEHLLRDRTFVKQYLGGKPLQKVTLEELAAAYALAVSEGQEQVGEMVCNHWILRNAEVYQFFAERLERVAQQFDEIEELPLQTAEELLTDAKAHYLPDQLYIFSVMNSVVFPEEVFERLRQDALATREEKAQSEAGAAVEELVRRHSLELQRLTDLYEKRLSGVQRKYHHDIADLKKQIAALKS